MARMNLFAEQLPDRPVTLPVFNLPPLDLEIEIREPPPALPNSGPSAPGAMHGLKCPNVSRSRRGARLVRHWR
jgi:hypothetical protein